MIRIFYDPKTEGWRRRVRVAYNSIVGRQISFELSYPELKKLVGLYRDAEALAERQRRQARKQK